jgi:hypothetical protein
MRTTALAVMSLALLAWVNTARAEAVKLEVKGTF